MSEPTINYESAALQSDPSPSASEPTGTGEHPIMRWLSLIGRLSLGGIMLVYGAEKLTDMHNFAHNIANYQLIPLSLVNIAAIIFVWAEIVCGVLLIAGAAVRGSALLSSALLIMFIIAIASAIFRGLEIDCGCFKPTPEHPAEKVGWGTVFRDIAYLGIGIFLIYFPRSPFTIDRIMKKFGE